MSVRDTHQRRNSELLAFFARFYKNRRGKALFGILLAPLQPLLLVPVPLLVSRAFEVYIPAGDMGGVVLTGLATLGMAVIGFATALQSRKVILSVTKEAVGRIRTHMLRQLYSMPLPRFNDADHGRLHGLIVHGTERLDVMSNAVVSQILPGLTATFLIGALLFVIDAVLASIVTAFAVVFAFYFLRAGRRVKREVRLFHDSYESFSGSVQGTLKAFDHIRSHGLEERELDRHAHRVDQLRDISGRVSLMSTAYQALNGIGVIMMGAVVLVVGGWLVIGGRMTVAELIAFYAALALMRPFLNAVTNYLAPVVSGIESLRDLVEGLELDTGGQHGGRRIEITGRVELRDLAFRYGDDVVLAGASLTLEPGEVVSLSGAVGAGKTTLVNILLGLYHADSGAVSFDGVDLSELDTVHMRRQVGVVRQNPALFPGTVAENISFNDVRQDMERVRIAAQRVGADTLITTLEEGYETRVGEDAVRLSGGQRQLIAVARALYREPRLVILDEPGNHLDAASVRRLVHSLRNLPWRPAVLIISHERTLSDCADRGYVLEHGVTHILDRRSSANSAVTEGALRG